MNVRIALVLVFVTLVILCRGADDFGCGVNIRDYAGTRRIVNGVKPNENLPFFATIQRRTVIPGEEFAHLSWCGGVIIARGYRIEKNIDYITVLTTANCVRGYRLQQITVWFGDHYWDKRKVIEATVIITTKTNKTGSNLNLALIHAHGVLLPEVKPARIATKAFECQHWVAGFGGSRLPPYDPNMYKYEDLMYRLYTSNLMKLQVNYLRLDDCNYMFYLLTKSIGTILPPEICFIFKNRNVCRGDEGGPLYTTSNKRDFYVRGIISYDASCGNSSVPGRAIDLTNPVAKQWIDNNLEKHLLYTPTIIDVDFP